ncbi:MAG TPA: MBL fold metallo-hydrolase [Gaiellaceae bacterium]|nr:MBL fold metallo-hydrolase [Gaiellaceae bacterium]
MKLTLVRHATLVLETSGRRILIDPMLDDAGARPPIEDTENDLRNPLVGLPFPAADVVAGTDGVVVTHLHEDHFDDRAEALIPPSTPLLTQPDSLADLRSRGFSAATDEPSGWLGLDVVRTGGRHGPGDLAAALGPVSGFVVDGVYVAGDTIWCDDVAEAIERHRPRTIVVNGSGARFTGSPPIVMDVADVRALRAATDGRVVVVHLEAINHCLERRDAYRGIDGVDVPADGETLEL